METEFVVFDEPKSNLQSPSEDAVYLEVLHGKEAGNRVKVSIYNEYHSDEVIEVLETLSTEDVLTAELENTGVGFIVKNIERL